MYGLLGTKVAIVTGSGSGIGRGICLAFANEGARCVVAELDPERADRTVNEIRGRGGEAIAVPCDVQEESQVRHCVARCMETFGGIDILVNNAIAPPQMLRCLRRPRRWSTPCGSQVRWVPCTSCRRVTAPVCPASNVINVASRGHGRPHGFAAYAPAKEAIAR